VRIGFDCLEYGDQWQAVVNTVMDLPFLCTVDLVKEQYRRNWKGLIDRMGSGSIPTEILKYLPKG
jgi:hypothetical protein